MPFDEIERQQRRVGPPKLQLIASGNVERSLPIKLTSARLRQGFLTTGQRRALVNGDTAGRAEADSYPPRSATKVPRPISPRVHPLSASDLNAAVTVVKLTPNSDASRRSVGRRSPGFNCPVRMAWHKPFAICSYRGAAPSALRLAIVRSGDIVLTLLSCIYSRTSAGPHVIFPHPSHKTLLTSGPVLF